MIYAFEMHRRHLEKAVVKAVLKDVFKDMAAIDEMLDGELQRMTGVSGVGDVPSVVPGEEVGVVTHDAGTCLGWLRGTRAFSYNESSSLYDRSL